jgi:ribonuclease J
LECKSVEDMNLKIHRGTKEIGGSCVEVWTESTRIVIDFGMPLVEKDGSEFDFEKYKNLSPAELIGERILPDINGLYKDADRLIDGIIISHAHQDHYGLLNFINPGIKCYLGEATHKIIEISNLFTPQNLIIENPIYFTLENSFQIGDFTITAYWADHSAFDAYSFLVEANGKKLFYSGDFRSHGRKAKAFKWFTHNAPQDVDYLLLEGTNIGRESKPCKTEMDIESEMVDLFKQGNKIHLIYTSGQNIDRLVSIYRACIRSDKILVVDVYVATVLKELSGFAKIPFPSENFRNMQVIFPHYLSNRLSREGNEQILYQFKKYKITKEEISERAYRIVMVVRPSMQFDLDHIPGIEGGNIIYAMWEGYLQKSSTKKFIDNLLKRQFILHHIHTSGHADIETLKKMVEAIKPKNIVPIHTFKGSEYKKIFSAPIIEMKDRETKQI